MKPSILISSHFAYFNVRTGMTLFTKHIAEYLSQYYQVSVHTLRDVSNDIVIKNNVTYLTGNHWSGHHDLVIGHAPHQRGCDIQLIDSVRYLDQYDPSAITIASTDTIKQALKLNTDVLNPIVYPAHHKTARGNKITMIGLSDAKGGDIITALAKSNPDIEFLGVRSGWQATSQPTPNLPNLELMDEVTDMKLIWSKTKLLLVGGIEQYGMAGVEASVSGIPTIALDCVGSREALQEAATFVPSKDVSLWNELLHSVLGNYQHHVMLTKARSDRIDSIKQLSKLKEIIDNAIQLRR